MQPVRRLPPRKNCASCARKSIPTAIFWDVRVAPFGLVRLPMRSYTPSARYRWKRHPSRGQDAPRPMAGRDSVRAGLQGGKTMARQTRPFIGINADFIAAGKVTTAHARLNAG